MLDQFNDVFWRMVAQTAVVASCGVNSGEWDPLNLNLSNATRLLLRNLS